MHKLEWRKATREDLNYSLLQWKNSDTEYFLSKNGFWAIKQTRWVTVLYSKDFRIDFYGENNFQKAVKIAETFENEVGFVPITRIQPGPFIMGNKIHPLKGIEIKIILE